MAEMNNHSHPAESNEKSGEENQIHPDYLCGIGPFKPAWLQKLANRNVYMIAYCILNICQGMFYTYMISILSTVEKRFAVPSRVTGFIMTGNEFSAIIAAIPVAYFGRNGHKPRWIACGMYISSFAALIIALPEFVISGNEALLEAYTNSSMKDVCHLNGVEHDTCQTDRHAGSFGAMALIFIGLFIYGLGTLPMWSLGYTYIDDNVPKKTMAGYLGISMGLRVLGPSAGYMLAGAFLRMYHDPKKTPDFGITDPRWVGAWWLGFIVISIAVVLSSSFMLLFPRKLSFTGEKPTITKVKVTIKQKRQLTEALNLPSVKEFPSAMKRILKNSMLISITCEATLYLLGIVGFGTFMPKYLEAQFGQSASSASVITGAASVSVMIIGMLVSGFIIQRFKPRPRILSGYSIFLGLVHVASLLGCMNITCEETVSMKGYVTPEDMLQLSADCNLGCYCDTQKFTPVCDESTQTTYFSACYAGCTLYNTSTMTYSNCTCLGDSVGEEELTLKSGKCSTHCNAFFMYIGIMTAVRLLLSTERIGGTLIFLRCMEPRDKSLAMGWLSTILCLLAFFPCTIIYGSVVDSTCLVWEESCNDRGNCWVYDIDKLRYRLHGLTAALILISQFFQCYLWYKCKHLKLYEEPVDTEDAPTSIPLKENLDHVNQ